MDYEVSSGGTESGIILENNTMTVLNGGIVTDTTVNVGGSMFVSSGGTATEIKENGGYVEVGDDANVTFVSNSFSGLVLSSARATVHSGTSANSTTVNNGGRLSVFSGGTANSTTVNTQGNIYVFSGGRVNNTTLNGGSMDVLMDAMVDNAILNSKGRINVGGGTINQVTVNTRGYLYVSCSGTANNTTVNGGSMTVSSGGTVNNTTVNSGGYLFISNRATANSIVENGGYVKETYEANVTFASHVIYDLQLQNTSATIHSGTTLNSATLNYGGGLLEVYSGGSVNNATVNWSSYLNVFGGGTARNTTIYGGFLDVSHGAKHTGHLNVLQGASISFASGSILDFDLTQTYAGDIALVNSLSSLTLKETPFYTVTVSSEQAVGVYSLADDAERFTGFISVLNTEGKNLGTLVLGQSIEIMGVMYTLSLACGDLLLGIGCEHSLNVVQGNVLGDETKSVNFGEAYYDTTISSGGTLIVSSGGTANLFKNFSGGRVVVSSGGTAKRGTLFGGELLVFNNAIVKDTTVSSGGSLCVSNGGTAHIITVNSSYLHIFEGGVVNITRVYSGGEIYVSTGGTANSTTIGYGGSLVVFSGGTANSTTVNFLGRLHVTSGGTANSVTINSGGSLFVSSGGVAENNTVNSYGKLCIANGGTVNNATVNLYGSFTISSGGVLNNTTVNSGGELDIHQGGTATQIIVSSGAHLRLTVASDTYIQGTSDGTVFEMKDAFISGYAVNYGGSLEVLSGGKAIGTTVNSNGKIGVNNDGVAEKITVNSGGYLYVSSGGTATSIVASSGARLHLTIAQNTYIVGTSGESAFWIKDGYVSNYTVCSGYLRVFSGGTANNTIVSSGGHLEVSSGGTANNTIVSSGGYLGLTLVETNAGGTANGIVVHSGGSVIVGKSCSVAGKLTFEEGAFVSMNGGSILDFDLTQVEAGAVALVNDLSIIQGTPVYTLTVDGSKAEGVYTLAEGAADFASTISVVSTAGDELGVLTVGETVKIGGDDYTLNLNEGGALSVSIKGGDTPVKPKWTYLVYMAADSDISYCALYDIVSMQQATIDSEIEVYVLADRTTVDNPRNGDYVSPYGTYQWDSLWPDTRVGKITYSPGLTVTVDWTSWGELDTGSIATLERFIDWGQEQSPAEHYGLIVWDHGRENATLCFDRTTDPDGEAHFTVSELSDLLKKKGNFPLVILNNCMLASELAVTQMAGSTDVIVVSEPLSYGMSTYNYNAFFNTITADMTPREMAAIMAQNVESPEIADVVTMLTSVDVTVSRLAEPLEALAEAIAVADNAADKTVLINAMLKAPREGCLYDGKRVKQSDLGFLIRDVLADPGYESTSEGFRKALADVKAALDAIVLEYRGVPARRGSGLTVCNTVCSAESFVGSGDSVEKADAVVKSYIISTYTSNPLWGGLLYDLCSTYLAESGDQISPPATFNVSYVDGLVPGGTVAVSDLGCFSGSGETFNGIHVIGEAFFRFLITAEDKAAGGFTVANDIGAEVTVSLLASDGTVIASGVGSVSFENLAEGTYYLRLQSGTNCHVTLSSSAEFATGVDRFDYAGSGQNERNVNGNGSIDKATPLDEGFYSGLLTCKGDTDYYRFGNIHTEMCSILVKGQDGWTVAEYDADGVLVQSAEFSDGQYDLTMDPLNYLLVEGAADLEDAIEPYTLNVIGIDDDSDVVVLDDLTGSKDEVSWEASNVAPQYKLELSTDSFEHAFAFETAGTAVDLLGLPAGTYRWRVMAKSEDEEQDNEWYVGEEFVSDNTNDKPSVFQSKADAIDDIFFATPNGSWSSLYCAKHVGSAGDWTGTGEMISAAGKDRIQDLFFGCVDPGTLCLTDSENGDALFLDDVYTVLPDEIEENTARLLRLRSIKAGAGDDIVDMTSQRFEYAGSKLFIYGGDGDDVIWASKGKNMLFGDAGNDRIVGASGNDVIAGGIGDDRMHGGGGSDIFTFCENWGSDTIEQLAEGSVTLWFFSGDETNWNPETLTYTDGENSVTVSGVSAEDVTLKFGVEQSEVFVLLYYKGAFAEFASQKIFKDADTGLLASV